MRFNLAISGMILAGAAFAVPCQEAFELNKENILAETASAVGEWVFSVGRARQTLRVGDEIGFSKAATLAFANIDLLNFKKAEWPALASEDEKNAAWVIYRSRHPFGLTIEGGHRVHACKTGNGKYLVVMAFPRASVFADTPLREDLCMALSQYRDELKKMEGEVAKIVAERSSTNRVETQTSSIGHGESDDGLRKDECLNVDLVF